MKLLHTRKSRYVTAATLLVASAASGVAIASSSSGTAAGIHVRHFASSRAVALAKWQRAAAGSPDPSTVASLRSRALAAAAANGDPRASVATAVATLHGQAMGVDSNSTPGSGADPVQQVYYVVVSGHFVAAGVPHPYGTPAPTGTALSLTINAVTGDETDFSILKAVPNVTSLGTPMAISLR
jgi:hypothetical protein